MNTIILSKVVTKNGQSSFTVKGSGAHYRALFETRNKALAARCNMVLLRTATPPKEAIGITNL